MTDLVLVVEDSDEDVEAIARAIGRSHPGTPLEFVRSGDLVLPRLRDTAKPRPGLVLLDLNMPGDGGLAVIRQVRAEPGLHDLILVVFTSSEDEAEAEACYTAGADSHVYKPINFALFQTVLRQTLDYWRSRDGRSAGGNVAHMVVPPPGDASAQT